MYLPLCKYAVTQSIFFLLFIFIEGLLWCSSLEITYICLSKAMEKHFPQYSRIQPPCSSIYILVSTHLLTTFSILRWRDQYQLRGGCLWFSGLYQQYLWRKYYDLICLEQYRDISLLVLAQQAFWQVTAFTELLHTVYIQATQLFV